MATADTPLKLDSSLANLGAAAPSSEPSTLWHDVYSHPGADGLAVVAAVAGAGLLYASRGALGFGLERTGTLLIEDTPYMGKALKQVLEDQGHKVTWLTGVTKLRPFTGITADGGNVVVKLGQFDKAFVDSDLKGSPLQGQDIVGTLRARKIFSIGTSSVDDTNELLRANGANVVGNKGVILTALANKIDLTASLRAPELQARLDGMRTSFMSEEGKPMRAVAENVMKKYL
jgi:CheY-like chemotaxis protein